MKSERAQAKAILKSFDYLILDNQELSNRIIGYFQLVQYIRDNKLSDNVIRVIIVYMHVGYDYDNMTAIVIIMMDIVYFHIHYFMKKIYIIKYVLKYKTIIIFIIILRIIVIM